MSREEFVRLMVGAFTATGWLYALMLTAKEAVGYMQHIPWYEMLIANVLILLVWTPFGLWVYRKYWNKRDEGSEQVELDPSAPREP